MQSSCYEEYMKGANISLLEKIMPRFLLQAYSVVHDDCYWSKIISLKLQDVSYKKICKFNNILSA